MCLQNISKPFVGAVSCWSLLHHSASLLRYHGSQHQSTVNWTSARAHEHPRLKMNGRNQNITLNVETPHPSYTGIYTDRRVYDIYSTYHTRYAPGIHDGNTKFNVGNSSCTLLSLDRNSPEHVDTHAPTGCWPRHLEASFVLYMLCILLPCAHDIYLQYNHRQMTALTSHQRWRSCKLSRRFPSFVLVLRFSGR